MAGALSHVYLLNTRPENQNHALTQAIQAQGGKVIECPMLQIEAIPFDYTASSTYAIFISANAVKYFFQTQKNHFTQVFAVGHQTAYELTKHGIKAITPEIADSEHLLQLPELQEIQNISIMIIKGIGGRNLLHDTLTHRGARVINLNVYQRLSPKITPSELKHLWKNNPINTILWTSQQSITQMLSLLDEEGKQWLSQQKIWVISERLSDIAQSYGIDSRHIIIKTLQGS